MPDRKVWDERLMRLAHLVATWSNERGRRVGAVIVDQDYEVRALGFNSFPRGVNDSIEHRHDRESGEKYFWSSHAERNAIYQAAKAGISLKGCSIYVPWFPCGECAKAIIQSGITELIAYEPDFNDQKWGRDFIRVIEMLSESGISVRFIDVLEQLTEGLL
jgi:dCMP deaminase